MFWRWAERIINGDYFQNKHLLTNRGISEMILHDGESWSIEWYDSWFSIMQYHDTSWLPKIGRLRKVSKSMCNPKDNLVRMIKTIFGIGTIRKSVVSVLEVKLNLPNISVWTTINSENYYTVYTVHIFIIVPFKLQLLLNNTVSRFHWELVVHMMFTSTYMI